MADYSTYVPSTRNFDGTDLLDIPDFDEIFADDPNLSIPEETTWDSLPSSGDWGSTPEADTYGADTYSAYAPTAETAQATLNETWDGAPSADTWTDPSSLLVDVGSNIPGQDLPSGDLYEDLSFLLDEDVSDYGDVNELDTVQGRLSDLLSSESDYMTLARTKAHEEMNARGLLNSSMALGATQRAAIDSALPIAQQDAEMRNRWRERVSGYLHEQKMSNAAMQQDMLKQRAMDEANWDQFITGMTHEQMLANSDILRQMEMQARELGQDWDAQQFAALNDRILSNLDVEARTNLANLDAATTTNLANLDAATRTELANLDAATSTELANLDAATRIEMQDRDLAAQWDSQNLQNLHETILANAEMDYQLTTQERDLMASWYSHLTQLDAGLVAQEIEIVANNIIEQMQIEGEEKIATLEMVNNLIEGTTSAWELISTQEWLKEDSREVLLDEMLDIQSSNLNLIADMTGVTVDWTGI